MKRLLGIIIFLAIVIGFYPTIINAEEREFTVTSYLTMMEYIAVPDVEKHAVGIYERRGIAVFKDGKAAAYHTRGTWDFINRNGPYQGYTKLTYEDGSTTMVKYTGTLTTDSGKLPKHVGKGVYIKGTGKYKGIKGTMTFQGRYITPYNKKTKGDIVIFVKTNYTLP